MLPEINSGSIPAQSFSESVSLSDVYVFYAPSACSPVSPGLTGSAIKLHADWLGRCAYIPCCGSSTAPSLANSPQDCQGARDAVERGCDPSTGWWSCPLWVSDRIHAHGVLMCSTAVCSRHTLASPVPGVSAGSGPVCRCPVLTEGATLHGDSGPWIQKPL